MGAVEQERRTPVGDVLLRGAGHRRPLRGARDLVPALPRPRRAPSPWPPRSPRAAGRCTAPGSPRPSPRSFPRRRASATLRWTCSWWRPTSTPGSCCGRTGASPARTTQQRIERLVRAVLTDLGKPEGRTTDVRDPLRHLGRWGQRAPGRRHRHGPPGARRDRALHRARDPAAGPDGGRLRLHVVRRRATVLRGGGELGAAAAVDVHRQGARPRRAGRARESSGRRRRGRLPPGADPPGTGRLRPALRVAGALLRPLPATQLAAGTGRPGGTAEAAGTGGGVERGGPHARRDRAEPGPGRRGPAACQRPVHRARAGAPAPHEPPTTRPSWSA